MTSLVVFFEPCLRVFKQTKIYEFPRKARKNKNYLNLHQDFILHKNGGVHIVALEAITTTGRLILDPFKILFYNLVTLLPAVVLAILVLILGYIVAYFIGYIVKWGIEKSIGKQLRDANLSKAVGHTNWSSLVGELIKWFVFVIFLNVAVNLLQFDTLSSLLDSFVRWLPNVLFAIIIFFAGIALAHYIDMKISEHTKMKGMRAVTGVIKAVIVFLVVLVALNQIGVNVDILQNTFLILVGALGLGLALALGIGLGLGLREEASDVVKRFKKNL